MFQPELISAKQLDDYVAHPYALIIDLRDEESYRFSHIRTAINIPYEKLETAIQTMQKMQESEDKTLVFYCDRGGASLKAAKQMTRKGYPCISVIGGFLAYRGQNLVFSDKK